MILCKCHFCSGNKVFGYSLCWGGAGEFSMYNEGSWNIYRADMACSFGVQNPMSWATSCKERAAAKHGYRTEATTQTLNPKP